MTKADEPRENNGEYVHVYGYLTYHSKDEARLYQGLGDDEYFAIPKSGVREVAPGFSMENPCLAKVKLPSKLTITYVGNGKAKLPASIVAHAVADQIKKGEIASPAGPSPCRPGCGSAGHCYCIAPGCWFDKDDAALEELGVEILERPAIS
jgi:hypothetical protein